MSTFTFRDCPCCGAHKFTEVQDKIHLDWSRECFACGYSAEMMPRSSTRNNSNKYSASPVADYFESTREGFRFAMNLEDLDKEYDDADSKTGRPVAVG